MRLRWALAVRPAEVLGYRDGPGHCLNIERQASQIETMAVAILKNHPAKGGVNDGARGECP